MFQPSIIIFACFKNTDILNPIKCKHNPWKCHLTKTKPWVVRRQGVFKSRSVMGQRFDI